MERNNVEYLERFGLLGDFRYYLGADSEHDPKYDEKINRMSPIQLTRLMCGYELGDESWADKIINFYVDATRNKEE